VCGGEEKRERREGAVAVAFHGSWRHQASPRWRGVL
jgi:hypothetical protein